MAPTRPTKRARTAIQSAPSASTSTGQQGGLFAPFRSLGHITTNVPFVVLSRSSKYLQTPALTVVTSLGSSWAMWEGQSLRLLFVGPDMGAPITSLAMSMDSVFAAAGSYVGRYVRGKEVGRFVLPTSRSSASDSDDSDSDDSGSEASDSDDSEDASMDEDAPEATVLTNLTIFGSTLLALSSSGTKMYVWDIPQLTNPASVDPSAASTSKAKQSTEVTPYATIDFAPGFTANRVVHPASYLNKVVVGSKEGDLAIWNVRTASLIHTFEASSLVTSPSPVTALTQSPAIDVLGVGYAGGETVLFDVRMGEVLGRVRLEGEGCGEVAGVAFRNDDISQTLAVSSSTGHVALFDLSAKLRLLHLVRAAHEGPVGGLEWIAGQPLMMTSSGDNSLKQWLFDSPTSPPRLLKQRSGHHAPPHLVRYYGDDGKSLLTAGADRALRYTSVVRDSRGYELSQGSIARKANHLGVKPSSLKLPVITSLSYSNSRSKDWDDVVTISDGEALGRSWSVEGKRVGKWTLKAEGEVKTTAVTACGNFGLVGSSAGEVAMYNMQSGMKRKIFKVPNAGAGDGRGRHVTGVATDSLNRIVVVSTLKGGVHFFNFQSMKLQSSITVPAGVTSILLQRENNLVAVVCDDLTVRIIDIETQRIVRELAGFRGRILDVAFSPDSRWVITTSQDSIIRTFDVPTGQLVDAFRTATVATSLSFSPTSDFLATAHVDSVGVYLWANRAQFSEVSLRSFVEEDLEDVALPTVQGVDVDEGLSELTAPVRWEDVQPYTTPDQLSDELLTLSLMPRSRWQTLLNLETIKQRNKPKEAPKAPERAPFFLPTLPGVKQRFDFGTEMATEVAEVKSRKLDMTSASVETEFVQRLLKEDKAGDYQSFFEYLKALSPSATDLELRSLTMLPHLEAFLDALSGRLASHRDFEAVQTFLACFLRIHGDVLVQNTELKGAMEKVAEEQKRESSRLMDLTHYSLGALAFLRSTPIA
ncbi:WD repeat protein, U3 small nucleolar RNA-associated protein 21 [Pseudohyphozyma bogoriensis]|nr:WD repeat protein, U3 small nucleolar RNA-associated protein 21 [Pseudohyphozyma bogoriensis]